MLLELSLRPAIACLLISTLLIAGCDRQSDAPGQANAAREANAAAADRGAPATGAAELSGTLDRSHAGEPAPRIAFALPGGTPTRIADFAGTPVLLNLWATWCAPCVAEMPTLDALAVREGGALRVLTVSQDLEGADKVLPFFDQAGFERLQPWLDDQAELSLHYRTNLPTTVLYDAEGREVWRMLGGMDWSGEAAAALIAEAR